VVTLIGDSTFFHAGMPALLNMVYNKSNPLVVILDNQVTAMTGHQPNPGSKVTGMGKKSKHVPIEGIVRAMGISVVRTVDQFRLKEAQKAFREALRLRKRDEPAVIIVNRPCQLLEHRRRMRKGQKVPRFEIDQKKCTKCGKCLYVYACPAIYRERGAFRIDKDLCTGCSMCSQVCPAKAIKVGEMR
jgi:indolepyruvate ferredoxin oxidoreductase alpha subunit